MTNIDSLVLSLCRAGIWGEKIDLPPSSEWESVFDKAIQQGIGGVIYDAIYHIKEDCVTTANEQIQKMVVYTYGLEIDYKEKLSVIRRIAILCEDNGIRMLLLKGYSLSTLYPNPEHRPIGDVDIYCFGDQPKLDALIEREWNIKPQKSSQHTVFSINEVEVENHITLFEDDCHRSNRITEIDCQRPLYEAQIVTPIDNTSLLAPNANLNALFLTRHSSGHFATDNIHIRHLLDWALFVKAYSNDIDWVWLMECSKRAKMHRFLAAQNTICIRYLGFPNTLFPSFYPDETELADRILEEILHPRFCKEIPSIDDSFIKYCKVLFIIWVSIAHIFP